MRVLGGVFAGASLGVGRVRALGVVFACSAVAASCVTTPDTNAVVASVREPVEFEGLLPSAFGSSVTLQYLTFNLTWADLGSTRATPDGTWNFSVSVPPNGWFPPCGVAIVRAVSNQGDALLVPDAACLTALPSNPPQEQIDACSQTTLVLRQAHVHDGDLSIVGAEQAEPHQCTTKVTGNLTVDNGASPSVELPSLHDVTGNVDITLNRYKDFEDPPNIEVVTGRFESPILASIGGSVALHTTKERQIESGAGQGSYDFGMDAVTSVGGDVLVENTAFPGSSRGLNALTSLGGNLTLDWYPNDVYAGNLLSSLKKVEGSLAVNVNPNANTMLRELERVGQNLTLTTDDYSWSAQPTFLDALVSVEGDLTLQRMSAKCSTLIALEYVGGALTFETSGIGSGHLGADSAAPLSVGAFAFVDGNASVISVGPNLEVRTDGNVTVVNNPNLCDCAVNAFLVQLETSGWSGTATTSNNGALASCVPCPGPATCP